MLPIESCVEYTKKYLLHAKVLEVACGTCEYSLAIKDIAKEITCLDIEDMSSHIWKASNIEFVKADAQKLPFREETFDAVVFYNAVGFLSDCIEVCLAEAQRVLRKKGCVIMATNFNYDRTTIFTRVLPWLKQYGYRYEEKQLAGMYMLVVHASDDLGQIHFDRDFAACELLTTLKGRSFR